MSLADGDYITVQDKIVAAINADTGSGGLRETGDPPVKLVEAELRSEPRVYRDHEVPAIAVVVTGKDETIDASGPVRRYGISFYIYCRGLDSESEIAQCQRIAHRMEELFREENATDRQLGDLPGSLSWSNGNMNIEPTRTEFITGDEAPRGQKTYAAAGIVEASLEIPAEKY